MFVRQVIAVIMLCLLHAGLAAQSGDKAIDLQDVPDATPTVQQLEARVQELERDSATGGAYEQALKELHSMYVSFDPGGQTDKAARSARKLWQLYEREKGPANELTISWMQSEADALLWDQSNASDSEAARILDQALARLADAPTRISHLQFSLLERKAYLARIAQPPTPMVELAILEAMTGIFEADPNWFSSFELDEQRYRLAALKGRIAKTEPVLRERAHAAGRRIWLAHESYAIKHANKCAGAVFDRGVPRDADLSCDGIPSNALVELYQNEWLDAGKILQGYYSIHFSRLAQDEERIRDDSLDPRSLASRGLDVLPGIADDLLKNGKTYAAPKVLETILMLGASAPDLPGAREKVIRAAELLLPLQRRASIESMFGDMYFEALQHVVTAYKATAPDLAAAPAAELDAARSLEDVLRDYENPNYGSPDIVEKKLRPAIERSIAAVGKESPHLVDFFYLTFRNAREGAGLELVAVDRLFELLGDRSPSAIEFAARIVRRYSQSIYGSHISEGQAFRLGMRILPAAEQVFGARDRVTQDIVAAIIGPALKLANDADRQNLLQKSEQMDLSPDWNLRSALLASGARQPALRMAWQMVRKDLRLALSLDSYELISILGDEADFAAYAEKLDSFGQGGLTAEGTHDIARTLRGDCEIGEKLRDRIAVEFVDELSRNIYQGTSAAALPAIELLQRVKLSELSALASLGDRATMDCFLRSRRFAEAANVIKSSVSSRVLSKRLGTAALFGAEPPMPANPIDLRPALVLASIGDWSGAEYLLRRLLNLRLDDLDARWVPTLFDTLAALKHAPDMSASQIKAAVYLKVLWRAKGAGASAADLDRAFQVAQRNELSAAVAIARMAARGLGGANLAAKVRKLQDLDQDLDRIRSRIGLVGGPEEKGIEEQRTQVLTEIAATYPRYYELIKPRALALAEVQKLLAADEVLILTADVPAMLGMPEETFVIVVTAKEARWASATLGTNALKGEVAALRCGLDEEEWGTYTAIEACTELLELPRAVDVDKEPLPFHLGRAHSLYQALLGPFESLINGKRLLVVPSGPLTSLPFNVLVPAKPRHPLPRTYDEYNDVAWLGARNALVTLPAVSSLASLRSQLASGPRAQARYAGYGNPVLEGNQRYCRQPAKAVSLACPNIPVEKVKALPAEARPPGRGARRSGGANVAKVYARGRRSAESIEAVRELCPLPDTEYEISCVAARFPARDRLLPLRLREKATERDIKALSQSGELSRYSILHFATHGLLAGDVRQITEREAEPALVLTPPETSTDPDDDGLLTASEVAALKLNADWVVLSACNTAAGEKSGAEALSGLARSFFYAGARSLLVSHWPVYSDAAVRLATFAFTELDRDKKAGRAEALQRSMTALMKDRSTPYNAHPSVWAPFVLVGDGRR